MPITFTHPWALILLLALLPTVWLWRQGRGRVRRARTTFILLVRVLILALLALSVAGVQLVRAVDELAVVFLVDVSDSVSPPWKASALSFVEAALAEMGPHDRAGIVVFGSDALVDRPVSAARELDELFSIPATGHTDIEEAIRLGCDAVSIHVNVGAATEPAMLSHLAEAARSCGDWAIPLVAMMYARGAKVDDEYAVQYVKHAARVGAEMGADIVKCNYTGDPESFREVVEGCPVPVVIAGGPKTDTDEEVLRMVEGALEAGAAGVSIGRNAFQHASPRHIVRAIGMIVHGGSTVEDGLAYLEGAGDE